MYESMEQVHRLSVTYNSGLHFTGGSSSSWCFDCFFLIRRRPPRSRRVRSSAASDVYKRQVVVFEYELPRERGRRPDVVILTGSQVPVSYTHLRAHETPEHLVCRLLLDT